MAVNNWRRGCSSDTSRSGFLAKRIEPKVSLGTFVLAALLADLLWCIFLLAGLEHVQLKPGLGAAAYWMNRLRPFYSSSSGATPK